MKLDSNEIQQIIPHRYPFLLVDQILECIPGKKAVGKNALRLMKCTLWGIFPKITSCRGY